MMADLGAMLRPIRDFLDLAVPYSAPQVLARLHAVGQIVEKDLSGPVARLRVRLPPHMRSEFAPYIAEEALKPQARSSGVEG